MISLRLLRKCMIYSTASIEFNEEPPRSFPTQTLAYATIGAVVLSIIAVSVYCTFPPMYRWIDHLVTHMHNSTISLGDSLLYISLPTTILAAFASIAICLIRKHKQRQENDFFNVMIEKAEYTQTLKSYRPAMIKNLKIMAWSLGALLLIAAVGGLIIQFVPTANQWFHQHALPCLQSLLQHRIRIWESILFVGCGSGATALLVNLALHILPCTREPRKKLIKKTPPPTVEMQELMSCDT